MIIEPGEIEEYNWDVTGFSQASVEVSFDGGRTWESTPVTSGRITVLVAHPEAPTNPNATVLQYGENKVKIKFVDSPEIAILDGGVFIATTRHERERSPIRLN